MYLREKGVLTRMEGVKEEEFSDVSRVTSSQQVYHKGSASEVL